MSCIQFLSHWLQNPAKVGSLVPSSVHLARAMAWHTKSAKCVIELGAGTGAITRVLAKNRELERLVVFEPSIALSTQLAKQYPSAEVFGACVHEHPEIFEDTAPETVIISGLPFRSLPQAVIAPTLELLLYSLKRNPSSKLIQFTYQPRAPFPVPPGFEWAHCGTVFRNFPPAGVWELAARNP